MGDHKRTQGQIRSQRENNIGIGGFRYEHGRLHSRGAK